MQGKKIISRETADHFASLLRQALEERYEGKFVFDPIEVESAIDNYGDAYLDTYIVFDGDQKNLDPRWTAHLGIRMWEELERMGIFNSPVFHYVVKNEWEEVFHGKHPKAYGPK